MDMETSVFVTSLATSFLIFVVLVIVHSIFSRIPENEVIYYPAKKIKNVPPYYKPGIFGWLSKAWFATEEEIIKNAGLDAAIYMTFLGSGNESISRISCVPLVLADFGSFN